MQKTAGMYLHPSSISTNAYMQHNTLVGPPVFWTSAGCRHSKDFGTRPQRPDETGRSLPALFNDCDGGKFIACLVFLKVNIIRVVMLIFYWD